tara:strand:+ start:11165 stop:12322 length:1158 start_codon:yes stop_codon:yes gene_type:complete
MIKKKINIICVTGTRADYPRVKPVLKLLNKDRYFNLKLIITGQHLEKKFGSTFNEIKKDNFKILSKIKIFNNDDSIIGMNFALQKCIKGMTEILIKNKPDILLLTVDRIETLGSALAAMTLNLPIIHIQGGEVTGTLDETIRHCVTKMSHIHFPANLDAKKRIIKMGENKNYVFNVGCPYIDYINNQKFLSKKELSKILKIDLSKDYALFTQHAVTSEIKENLKNLKISIDSMKLFKNINFICLFSNADAGGRSINALLKKQQNIYVFKNFDEYTYLSLMQNANFMIGNSSAGIREAPSFGIPAINIGNRQNGRLRAQNVIDVPNEKKKIVKAIEKCLKDKKFLNKLKKIKNPYGDGNASKRIISILKKIDISNIPIQKIFIDEK